MLQFLSDLHQIWYSDRSVRFSSNMVAIGGVILSSIILNLIKIYPIMTKLGINIAISDKLNLEPTNYRLNNDIFNLKIQDMAQPSS